MRLAASLMQPHGFLNSLVEPHKAVCKGTAVHCFDISELNTPATPWET